ncbi:hypothetical protein [Corallincola spongiicola]|uniref:NAD-dependent epimerase/dehydratase family protein n=1 Tax=Corallincola spongiicola TaxID=2520508 RepID=A0ABY1WR51_9GAMM|nr:hypothetical protein [Corallincola spongiicola]TAA47196.1 hypothetical protein EXY25_08120 [Corallincola spongiicola]
MRILLFGASGFIGGQLAANLLADSRITALICPQRQKLSHDLNLTEDNPLQRPVIDFNQIPANLFNADKKLSSIDWLLLCLGTHSGHAGSYQQVDLGYTVKAATLAREAGIKNCLLVSSTLASAKSLSPYLRCKGEAEQALVALNFDRLGIFQPGPLTGRPALRWSEKLGTPLLALAAKLSGGIRSPFAPVAGKQVAASMTQQVLQPDFSGVKRFRTADMLAGC